MRKFDTFAYNETAGKSFFSCHFFVLIYTETDVSWYLGLKVSQTLGRWPSCPATLFLSSTSFEMASRLLISLSCNLCASLGRRCFQSDMIIGILPEVSPIRQRDWTVPWNVMNFQEFLNDFDIIFIIPRGTRKLFKSYLLIHLWDSIRHVLEGQKLHPQMPPFLVHAIFWRC